MFTFENPAIFFWLIGLGVLVVFYLLLDKKVVDRKNIFADKALVQRLFTFGGRKYITIKRVCFVSGLFFLVIALANPQWGYKNQEVKVERTDIYIALDISNSMNVTDVSPSRLEKAKKFVTDLIEYQKGNRIGIIFFAGNAYLQMPLTFDFASALMYVKSITTDMAPTQGSSIGEAINLSQRFQMEDENAQQALIIVSDGDDHDDTAIKAAEEAVSNGTIIFTVGIGTEKGSTIPIISDEGEDLAREEDGTLAISKLNYPGLQAIAKAGNGNAYRMGSSSGNILKDINQKLTLIQKETSEKRSFTEFNSYFYIFILLAMFCFLAELMLPDFKRKIILPFLFVCCFISGGYGQSAHRHLRNGDQLYGMNRFMEAEKQYFEAEGKKNVFQSTYNKGNAQYQQKKYGEAEQTYQNALKNTTEQNKLSSVYHNLGNTYFQQKKYQESVEAYKNALKNTPGDKETIENLLKARKLLQKQQQEENQKKKDQQKGNPKKEDSKPQDPSDQNPSNDQQKNDKKGKPSGQPKELSQAEAEKLMEIIENEDKKVNKKIRRGNVEQKIPAKPW